MENGVKDLTEQVPSEKIILGIPLYMRLWEEDYEGNVSAKTLNMEDANKLMKEKDKYPIWLKNEVKYILLIMKMEKYIVYGKKM